MAILTIITIDMMDDMVKEFINRQFNWEDVKAYLVAQQMTISKYHEVKLYNKMVEAYAEA